MKLLIVITIDGRTEYSGILPKKASKAVWHDRNVDLPNPLREALRLFIAPFPRTLIRINSTNVTREEFGPELFEFTDFLKLAELAARCGSASVASKYGRIDINRLDDEIFMNDNENAR